jgi:dipeptidyl aminopeptidase/acylaminoacyl peptidase
LSGSVRATIGAPDRDALEAVVRLPSIEDIALDPQGTGLALVVRFASGDGYVSSVVVAPRRSAANSLAVSPHQGARGPRWSPDGRTLAYVTREELCIWEVATGACSVVGRVDDPGAPAWSPTGEDLAVCAGDRAQRDLLVFPRAGGAPATVASHAGLECPAWSPLGDMIACCVVHQAPADPPRAHIAIFTAGGGPVPRDSATMAFAVAPSWSPNGESIAFFGVTEPRIGLEDPALGIWTEALGSTGPRCLLDAGAILGRPLSDARGPEWCGDQLIALRAHRGDIHVVRLRDGAEPEILIAGDVQATCLSAAASHFACVESTPLRPSRAIVRGLRASRQRPRPHISLSTGPAIEGVRWERRAFHTPNGERDGFLMQPSRRQGPTPLLIAVHGGPHGFAGSGFLQGHCYRYALVIRGWSVLALNATGSGSYGQAFADGIRGHWGEHDLPEHLAALDELIAAGDANPSRVAIAGHSYGGYLAAWAVCHVDRFRAAVVGAPIGNLTTFYATSDIGQWYTSWEMRGTPRDADERYRQLSPVTHAGNASCPVLLIHGEADVRCPVGQSHELHAALPHSELVNYPGAGHRFYRDGAPSLRLDYNRRIIDFLEREVP